MTRENCHATITRGYGLPLDAGPGVHELALRGFRAHCKACGYLGRLRSNYRTCQWDVTLHNREARA